MCSRESTIYDGSVVQAAVVFDRSVGSLFVLLWLAFVMLSYIMGFTSDTSVYSYSHDNSMICFHMEVRRWKYVISVQLFCCDV